MLIAFPCRSRHLLTNRANPSRANPRAEAASFQREMPRSCKHEAGLGNATTSSRIIYKWLFCPARSAHSCAAFSLHVCSAAKCCFREGSRAAFKILSKSLHPLRLLLAVEHLPAPSPLPISLSVSSPAQVIRRIILATKISARRDRPRLEFGKKLSASCRVSRRD